MPFQKIQTNTVEKTSLDGADFAVFHVRFPLESIEGAQFYLNETVLEWHEIERADLPKGTRWFAVYADLTRLKLEENNRLALIVSDIKVAEENLTLSGDEIRRLQTVRDEVSQKRHRLREIASNGRFGTEKLVSIDETRHNPSLRLKSDKVSTHPYSPKLLEIMRSLPDDALALDLGAGFRFSHHPQIVSLEIFDYPSTDVIAFGNEIPFKDGSFDCVYTNAVLEHVENPFDVAQEIARVLKPGGVLYSSIPFLQVEHGYPFHYFNATRMGHRKLFEDDFDVESVSVGPAGHPWHIVMRSLGLLRSGLPRDLRDQFNSLTVGEILDGTYSGWVNSPFGNCSDETMWRLAASTVVIAKRKG